MSRTNVYITDSTLASSAGQHLALAIPTSGPVIPEMVPYVPSEPHIATVNVVHVDCTYGDDTKAAANPGKSTIFPYRTFSAAWTYTVTLANADGNKTFCLKLRNPDPTVPLYTGSTPQLMPLNSNVTIRGEGAGVTVFTSIYDYLTFVPNVESSFTLDIGDLTLQAISILANPAASGSSGSGFPNGFFLNGNGTTHIRDRIDVFASNGSLGATVTDASAAGHGGLGGSMNGVRIKGFVAASGTAPKIRVQAGSGGNGGDAVVFMTGEYADTPSYGTPGNGGSNGTVNSLLIEDMDCLPANYGGDLNPIIGGWSIYVRPGTKGLGGKYNDGPSAGMTGGSDGTQTNPGERLSGPNPVTVLVMRSKVSLFDSTLAWDQVGGGYLDVTCVSCWTGYDPNVGRFVIARYNGFVSGALHPSVTVTSLLTTNSGVITDALYC